MRDVSPIEHNHCLLSVLISRRLLICLPANLCPHLKTQAVGLITLLEKQQHTAACLYENSCDIYAIVLQGTWQMSKNTPLPMNMSKTRIYMVPCPKKQGITMTYV